MVAACCLAYVTQSIAVNFAPLLFLTFNRIYGIPLSKITLLITLSFAVQLITDLFSAKFADILGSRSCMAVAHILTALGYIGLGIFPEIFPSPFIGIVTACILYSCGCGLIEVIATPIISSYSKSKNTCLLSLLQSFFCWGTVFVIILSTVFFYLFNTENWQILSCIWAIIPAINVFLFLLVPLPSKNKNGKKDNVFLLVKNPLFWILAIIMLCGGAAEHSISQWASVFTESYLNIPKALGDILGPCVFATLMGAARIVHAKINKKIDLTNYMFFCGILCTASFFMTAFIKIPPISFIGFALCGFSCGVFWPGTFSLATEKFTATGTTLFALLAFAGDTGSTLGPSIVGFTASITGNNLSLGIIFSVIFPIIFTLCISILYKKNKITNAKHNIDKRHP